MKRTHLPLNALRVFEAAARHLSFTRAADELAVTPAAVGQQIRTLEDVLGLILFKRTAKGLQLTPEAESSLSELKGGFEKFESAVKLMQSGQGSSVLTLAVPESFASKWLVHKLHSYYAKHSHMTLRIFTVIKTVDFAQENIDLAIVYDHESQLREFNSAIVTQKLLDGRTMTVANPKLAKTLHTPDDLAHAVLIHDGNTDGYSRQHLHFNTMDLVVDAVIAGLGIANVPAQLIADQLASGALVQLIVPSKQDAPDADFWLMAPEPQWRQKKVQDFVVWLNSQAK